MTEDKTRIGMTEGDLKIEVAKDWKDLIVIFSSRMADLTDVEKECVRECLSNDAEAGVVITELYESLRSNGHADIAQKIEPYLQQGQFGPIFDNAHHRDIKDKDSERGSDA